MSFVDTSIQIPNNTSFTGPLIRALQYTINSKTVYSHSFVLHDAITPTNFATISNSGLLAVDGSGAIQPISGSVSVSNFPGTQTISGIVSTKTSLTPASPTFNTVGVSSAQAVASNVNRKGLTLINTSSNTISLAFGTPALLNKGITLLPGAGFVMDEYTFTTSQVNAIASSASSNLAIQEFST